MLDNTLQRDYYRIFTGTNQAEGYDKIHLGYEAETTEIDLKKNKTTYFHMPFFAGVTPIEQSSLIADGAIPGPIPALADRIHKKLGNYGDSTPWGSPSDPNDGTWLCSWLYAVSSEPPKWLDRYYDPGRLVYKEALEGEAEFTDYIKHDPVYYDVPSNLTLEPGVLYKYFHQGEQAAVEAISSFAGPDNSRLRLDIEDWSCLCPTNPEPIDRSIYGNSVTIRNFTNDWIVSLPDPGYQDRNSLSFDNNDFIECKVSYSEDYNLENEFTLSFWINNKNWEQASSTQLVGNLRRGGYGVFYNNLNNYPIFVIPETFYGHLFYFNQEGNLYTEKNVQTTPGVPTNPEFICINSNTEIVSLNTTLNRLVKYNHLGDVLTFSKNISGDLITVPGTPKLLALSGNDLSVVVTDTGTYVYDKDLILIQNINQPYGYEEQIAFDYNGNLIRELSCIDVKIDSYNQKWVIKENGELHCNNIPLSGISSNCTNLAVDPEDNLWVLAGFNTVYKFNTKQKTLIDTYTIGVQTNITDKRNISFIQSYDREKNNFTWYSLIYHNFEKTLYQVNLNGVIIKDIFLPSKLNTRDPVTALQDKNLLQFFGKGDFTGYENKRIFNKVLYNNNPQLQFKLAVKPLNSRLPTSINTLSIPVQYFSDNVWHLITITVKNKTAQIYINNYLRDTLQLPNTLNLNYEYKNDFFIGTPCGKSLNYNLEINSQSVIWNGYIDSIRVYDYAIDPKFIQYFIREKIIATDIEWNIPTAALQYVEVIDRFFKHRLPGSKSIFFNIRLTGTNIKDPEVRKRIEEDIKQAIEEIKPAYAELLRVEWID